MQVQFEYNTLSKSVKTKTKFKQALVFPGIIFALQLNNELFKVKINCVLETNVTQNKQKLFSL